jgi:hypothetical protein
MSKLDSFRKLIREELRAVIKEELPKILKESVMQKSDYRQQLKEKVEGKTVPLTLNTSVPKPKPSFNTKNPLGSLLNETAISMTTDDVAGFANTQGGFMEGMHQKETSVGSVDAMLAGAKRSSAIEMVEIDTVPDFSGVMNAMKSKGLI